MMSILQRLYSWIITRRNAQFDARTRPIVPVTKPVISIGNISVGGTGKSPAVQLVARILLKHGMRPAIVMRGYRRRSRGLVVVHDGSDILTTVERAGDEAFMHASMLGVPVVVSSDKVQAAAYAAGCLPCDVIIVDDGYQHRALHRCCDIVLVNDETMNGTLLPHGRLREPLSELRRASIIVCAHDGLRANVLQCSTPNARIVSSTSVMQCYAPKDAPVVIVSGIANPERIRISLEQQGYTIAKHIAFGDHHRYRTADIWKIRDVAASLTAVVVTTDKDIAKIRSVDSSNDLQQTPLYVAHVQMMIHAPEFTERILQDIKNEDCHLEE
jgi:tetraacyldisaccharide 4'-kinase